MASMRESKEFRKGIHILAWELKELYMRAEDLQTAAMDLQLLRVTKQLQAYLGENDQRQTKQQEIATLERTLDAYSTVNICYKIFCNIFYYSPYLLQIFLKTV